MQIDYYLYNGDVEVSFRVPFTTCTILRINPQQSLRVEKFKALYDLAKNDQVPNYNLDVL